MEVNDEIIIRDLIRDEEEAVVGYEKAKLNVKDEELKKVLEDIKNEELVHIGELKELLNKIGVNDKAMIQQGEEEAAEKLMESIKELYAIFY